MFSGRARWNMPLNRLTRARQERAAKGLPILDLTETNPTQVGLDLPIAELAEAMRKAARAPYQPEPRGAIHAREALASVLSSEHHTVSADDLLLTASTSEAYSFLFKLFCDAGDEVITGIPSYPLLDHLVALESVRLRQFRFDFERRWTIDPHSVAKEMSERTRALVVVHPSNPAGSFLSRSEQAAMAVVCQTAGIPLISDEVFIDYPLSPPADVAERASFRDEGMVISLGGLSKSAGLPHFKLGWIHVGGSEHERRRVLAGLEMVADQYLSVSTPVQMALPELLRLAPSIRAAISERTAKNLVRLREEIETYASLHLLPVEGGWSAVVRYPSIIADEDIALELLEHEGVLLHPGYFFDFPADGYLVLSLLCEPQTFRDGVARVVAYLRERIG